jgi:DNA gyrase/topoisomerase IV subunit B
MGKELRARAACATAAIIILADADSDGHHIATLLLTFLYRTCRSSFGDGQGFLAQPPLYRIDIGKETVLGARRRAPRSAAEAARQRPLHARDHALQGARRDDAEGACGRRRSTRRRAACCASRSPIRS